jgi:hypothetical protein
LFLNTSKSKLYFDIIEPVNIPSEHIVISGSEENPYCNNSAITQVLVNDEIIGNYPKESEVLMIEENRIKLTWDGGGVGKEHIVNNATNLFYGVSPKRNENFTISGSFVSSILGSTNFSIIRNFSDSLVYLSFSFDIFFTGRTIILNNVGNAITAINNTSNPLQAVDFRFRDGYVNTLSNPLIYRSKVLSTPETIDISFNNVVATNWEVVIRDDENWYYYDILPQTGEIVPQDKDYNWGFNTSTDTNETWNKMINNSSISLINNKILALKINNNTIQTLEETDEVKVICQPQIVPIETIEKGNYNDVFPPTENKIIYL